MSPTTYVGIDVSAKTLDLFILSHKKQATHLFENNAEGHEKIVRLLRRHTAQVCLEATGNYSLDLALALHKANIPCMIVNPRVARNFFLARNQRAKTDRIDAAGLAEFSKAMPFHQWVPPSQARLELMQLGRHRAALVADLTVVENRLKSLLATEAHTPLIAESMGEIAKMLQAQQIKVEERMMALIAGEAELQAIYSQLSAIKGIKEKAGAALMAELLMLPKDLTTREVVAHVGLDPRVRQSGSSVRGARTISRNGNPRVRATLYMVALVASQYEPSIRAKYQDMVERVKKPKRVALTAIMRKLLTTIWSMIRSGQAWNGEKFGRSQMAAEKQLATISIDAALPV